MSQIDLPNMAITNLYAPIILVQIHLPSFKQPHNYVHPEHLSFLERTDKAALFSLLSNWNSSWKEFGKDQKKWYFEEYGDQV